MSSDNELYNLTRPLGLALAITNEQIVDTLMNFVRTSPNNQVSDRWEGLAPAVTGTIMIELMRNAQTSPDARGALDSVQRQLVMAFLIDNKTALMPAVVDEIELIQSPQQRVKNRRP
jgi:hypothetical protein